MTKTKYKVLIPKFIFDHRWFLLTILFVVLLCLIPLNLMATTRGHDYGFHLQRIEALAEEMRMGNFFPRIYSILLDGNGYAAPLFYGDLFLMIPGALIVWGGFTLIDAYAFFVAFIFLAVTLSMYFCTVSITKSQKGGFIGALMYGLSSYLVTDLIQRGAIGEAQAFIFLPITFLGFYQIMYGDMKKWYFMSIGLAAMIYCHVLSSLVTVLVLCVFLVALYRKILEKPMRLVLVFVGSVVFFLLSANFIFPMLEQLQSTQFLATDGYSAIKWGTLSERSMPWWALFYDFASSLDILDFYIPNGIGISGLVFTGIYIFAGKKPRNKFITLLLSVSAVMLFMTTSLFPWKHLQSVAGILQFPWRLLVYPTFFIALATAMYFGCETQSKDHSNLVYLVMALSLYSYICCGSGYFNSYAKSQIKNTEVTYTYVNYIGGAAEYLPSSDEFERNSSYAARYKDALIKSADKIYSDGNPQLSFLRADRKFIVEFSGMNKDNAYLDVPLLMYTGYSAYLDDGTKLECYYGKYNRIRVNVGDIREGTVTFEYTGTIVQKISGIISILSILAISVYIVLCSTRKKVSHR